MAMGKDLSTESSPLLTQSGRALTPPFPGKSCSASVDGKVAPERWRRRASFATMLLLVFNLGAAYSVMAPFYPKQAEAKGLSATEYGLVFGVFMLSMFVACPLLGKYITVLGASFVFKMGGVISAITVILFGVLPYVPGGTKFLLISLVLRVFTGIGDGAMFTAAYTIVARTLPKNLGSNFAMIESVLSVGQITGPLLGGILFELGGFPFPFAVIGSSMFVLGVVLICLLESEDDDAEEATINMTDVLRMPNVWIGLSMVTSCAIATGFVSATLEPHIRNFNLSPVMLGVIFVVNGGIYGLVAPIWGRLCDNYANSVERICAVATFLNALSFVFIGPASFLPFDTSLFLVVVALVLNGIGAAGQAMSGCMTIMYEVQSRYPDNASVPGIVAGVFNAVYSFGLFLGPSLGGVLVDTVGFRRSSVYMLLQLTLLCVFLVMKVRYTSWRIRRKMEQAHRQEQFCASCDNRKNFSLSSSV